MYTTVVYIIPAFVVRPTSMGIFATPFQALKGVPGRFLRTPTGAEISAGELRVAEEEPVIFASFATPPSET